MKIGIFSKTSENFFGNGCNQQAVFVYELLNSIDSINCYILINADGHYLNCNVIHTNTEMNKVFELDLLICLSAKIVDISVLKQLHEAGVKIVYYNCGNEYYIYQEDILFDTHHYITDFKYYEYYSELWSIPNYKQDRYFYETLYNKKMITVPYIWNTTITNKYKDLTYNKKYITNPTKYLLIAEPNAQLTKTCLIPLLICERLFNNGYTNIKILVLSQLKTTAFNKMLRNLQIYKEKKVELYDREVYFNVIKQLKELGIDMFLVSHHRDNPLNFLHLETLYLQYPLIHNCELYKYAGYYYNNIKEGAEQLLYAIENHHKQIDEYDIHTQRVLQTFSPFNKNNKDIYLHIIHKTLYG